MDNVVQLYIDKGHEILDEKYWEEWDRIAPIRVSDLYMGFDLASALVIIERLNAGAELKECSEIMHNQDHSGMSWGLVRSLVYHFCDRGVEFALYVGA